MNKMNKISDLLLSTVQHVPIEVLYEKLKDSLNKLDNTEDKEDREEIEKEVEFACSLVLTKRVILNVGIDKMKSDLNKVEIIKELGDLSNDIK
jgi:hypothetical protein